MNDKVSKSPNVQEKKPTNGMALVYQRLKTLEDSVAALSKAVEELKAVAFSSIPKPDTSQQEFLKELFSHAKAGQR